MDKGITIRRQEMIGQIYSAINNARLPAFAVADVLRGLLGEAERAAEEQLQFEMRAAQEPTAQEPAAQEPAADTLTMEEAQNK